MFFTELKDAELPESLRADVDRLLDIKMNAPELKIIPRVTEINDYLDCSIQEIRAQIASLPDERDRSWAELNQLFLLTLDEYGI